MKNSKKSLIAIQGTAQFLAAYIALRWYEESIQKESSDTTILLYDTSVSKDNESLFLNSVKMMAQAVSLNNVIFISETEMRDLSLNWYSKCKRKLKSKLDNIDFDSVLIARDYGSFGTQLILNAYPNALSIEYGDSFGLVGNENALKTSFSDFLNRPLNILKGIVKKVLYNHYPKRINFDLTILTLPMDWSGRYLAHKNLIVPPKAFATDLIMKMVNQLPDLINFCNEILNHVPNNSHLYLTSNLANSGLTNYENELSLYEDVIRETSEIGKCIILKNHPRASNLILKDLYEKLKDQYTVILIDNNEYSLYPIELWLLFIEKCCILPVFSSSVVSLKYFYNKDSIMPLSEKKIDKYLFRDSVPHLVRGELFCRNATNALERWDGKSALWKTPN